MKHKIITIISSFIGACLFFTYIWYRFIRIRLPKELSENITIFQIVIFSLFLFLTILTLIYTILALCKKNIYSNPWLNIIENTILKSLQDFDAFIKNNCVMFDTRKTYCDFILERIGYFLIKNKYKSIYILLILIFVPAVTMSLLFFIEVVFYNKIFIVYKVFYVLLLPLVIKYILYSIQIYININLQTIEPLIELTIENTNKIISLNDYFTLIKNHDKSICKMIIQKDIIKKNFLTLDQQEYMHNDIVSFLNFAFPMLIYLEIYENKKLVFQISTRIINSILYSTSLSYIILYGLGWFI